MKRFQKATAILFLIIAMILPIMVPEQVKAYSHVTLFRGKTVQLSVNTNKKVRWISSDSKVASVSQNGLVTAKKGGYSIVIAYFGNSHKSWIVQVPMKMEIADEYDVSFPRGMLPKKAVVLTGKKQQLKLNGIEGTAVWTSSNPSVATVSGRGVVTGVKKGSATITAKVKNKNYNAKINVTEKVLSVNKNQLTVAEGQKTTLMATLKPIGDQSDTIYVSVYHESKAEVTLGEWNGNRIPITITGTVPGKTYVTVESKLTKEKINIPLTVTKDPDKSPKWVDASKVHKDMKLRIIDNEYHLQIPLESIGWMHTIWMVQLEENTISENVYNHDGIRYMFKYDNTSGKYTLYLNEEDIQKRLISEGII